MFVFVKEINTFCSIWSFPLIKPINLRPKAYLFSPECKRCQIFPTKRARRMFPRRSRSRHNVPHTHFLKLDLQRLVVIYAASVMGATPRWAAATPQASWDGHQLWKEVEVTSVPFLKDKSPPILLVLATVEWAPKPTLSCLQDTRIRTMSVVVHRKFRRKATAGKPLDLKVFIHWGGRRHHHYGDGCWVSCSGDRTNQNQKKGRSEIKKKRVLVKQNVRQLTTTVFSNSID